MTVDFELEGHGITAPNGGPDFSFTRRSHSLAVNCESQQEVDYLWTALSEGGEEDRAAGSKTATASGLSGNRTQTGGERGIHRGGA